MSKTLVLLLALLCLWSPAQAAPTLADLKSGQVVDGFRSEAVYLNGADQPVGARLVHQRTGFTFDFLQVESVPQAFVWVNTYPTSLTENPTPRSTCCWARATRDAASPTWKPCR